MDLDLLPPDPFTYASALASGMSRRQLRTAVSAGRLCSPARGWYARRGPVIDAGERWETTRADHLRRLRAALHTHPGCAGSHDSSGLVHDLPIVVAPTAEVQLTKIEDYPTSRRSPGLTIHHADSAPTETVEVDGLRTTLIPRTLADILRTRRLPHALATLDQSIRQGRVRLEDVRDELSLQRHWVGKSQAMEVLELVDPRRESWGESHSYGVLAQGDFPRPLPQVEILDEAFQFVARLDGLFDHEGAFFEVDGESKYFIGADEEQPEEVVRGRLVAEHRRHTRLERLGLVGARWSPELAMTAPDEVWSRMNRAIAQARRRTFVGWARWDGQLRRLPLVPRERPQATPGRP